MRRTEGPLLKELGPMPEGLPLLMDRAQNTQLLGRYQQDVSVYLTTTVLTMPTASWGIQKYLEVPGTVKVWE